MSKLKQGGTFSSVLQLGKTRISVSVTLTGFLGYYRASGEFNEILVFTLFGILFMSMGSSTFNQVQERKTDRLMKRTAGRPLPAGRISLKGALISGAVLSITGFILLMFTGSALSAGIGIFTLLWYNLIYTPLKKITPFAVFPGALIGALPPLIGWTAAGGALLDKEIILISFFLFIGQMPHYWLLMIKLGDEFKEAGLSVITEIFSKTQLSNISFIWIFAAAVSVMIFPVAGIMHSNLIAFMMVALVVFFIIRMYLLSSRNNLVLNWRKAFTTVNLFYLFILFILIADKFFGAIMIN
ncbi:MAG: protoheme IX farnesyltransferase [Bacteroidales bacterium]